VRLITFIPPGRSEPLGGEASGEEAVAFEDGASVVDRLAAGSLAPARGERWPLEQVRLLAPVPQPRMIFGIGLNYSKHVAETGGEPPAEPIVFTKPPSASAPPTGPVVCPPVVRRLDYEGELAVVIGAGGRVAGYAVANDVSARDLQRREPQWTRAKGADTFCPWGPWITTAQQVADPHALTLRTWVNGELRQDASTSDLIFGVERLVEFIGEAVTLEPGDVILTGTPSGVGMAMDPPRFLANGDVVRIEIEGIGAIEHRVVVGP